MDLLYIPLCYIPKCNIMILSLIGKTAFAIEVGTKVQEEWNGRGV